MSLTFFVAMCGAGFLVLVPFTALGLFTWDTKNSMFDRVFICLIMTQLLVLTVVLAYMIY